MPEETRDHRGDGIATPEKTHDYRGDGIVVRYLLKRCIHAAECVRGLPAVFDPQRRPWVDARLAGADAIAEIVTRCPTGALHYQRSDGGAEETADETNSVLPTPHGPYYLRGDLEIRNGAGQVLLRDTRVALCRCGHSANKPFCDNSHWNARFPDDGRVTENRLENGEPTGAASEAAGDSPPAADAGRGPLRITVEGNGPLRLSGPIELWSSDANSTYRGTTGALCRCGRSGHKPYCDGSHKLGA